MNHTNKYFVEVIAMIKSFTLKGEMEVLSTIVFVELKLTGNEGADFFIKKLAEKAKNELRLQTNGRAMPENMTIKNIWLLDTIQTTTTV